MNMEIIAPSSGALPKLDDDKRRGLTEKRKKNYGRTTIPPYVTSVFRSQVFSYLRVEAS